MKIIFDKFLKNKKRKQNNFQGISEFLIQLFDSQNLYKFLENILSFFRIISRKLGGGSKF